MRDDLAGLAEFANRYAGLGVTEILADTDLSVAEKRRRVTRRQTALRDLVRARPDLDLDLATFTRMDEPTARAFYVDLDDVADEDRPWVRRELMRLQRVHRLTDSFADADRLLAVGLDNASKIADVGDTDRLATLTGLPRPAAERIPPPRRCDPLPSLALSARAGRHDRTPGFRSGDPQGWGGRPGPHTDQRSQGSARLSGAVRPTELLHLPALPVNLRAGGVLR